MGLSLEFYAGDAKTIGAAFTAVELDGLRDGSRAAAYADFSLHLAPRDLDLLSEAIAEPRDAEPCLLSDSLRSKVGGTTDESGVHRVDPEWVRLVATLPDDDAPAVVTNWCEKLSRAHTQPIPPTPAIASAVLQLVALCRIAMRDGLDVVHAWYL